MTDTLQKDIRDFVAARLALIPSCTVFLAPRREIGQGELPALCLYSGTDQAASEDDDHARQHERVYTLRVEIRASGRPEEDATDSLAQAVRRAILTDDTFGSLVYRTTWSSQAWDGDEADYPLAGTILEFRVHYLWRPE